MSPTLDLLLQLGGLRHSSLCASLPGTFFSLSSLNGFCKSMKRLPESQQFHQIANDVHLDPTSGEATCCPYSRISQKNVLPTTQTRRQLSQFRARTPSLATAKNSEALLQVGVGVMRYLDSQLLRMTPSPPTPKNTQTLACSILLAPKGMHVTFQAGNLCECASHSKNNRSQGISTRINSKALEQGKDESMFFFAGRQCCCWDLHAIGQRILHNWFRNRFDANYYITFSKINSKLLM